MTYETQTRQEELASLFWDFYKEVHGFRPRHINISGMSEAQLESKIDGLEEEGKIVFALKKEAEERAKVRFEKRLEDTIAFGAFDRAQAFRWIHDAEGTGGDSEYLCYKVGLPYGYFNVSGDVDTE